MTVIKSVVLAPDRHINQWNTIDRPEINPYIYGLLIFHNNAKTIKCGKSSVSINCAGTNEYLHAKKKIVFLTHTIHKN